MVRVLIAAFPYPSGVHALTPVAETLVRHGMTVLFLTGEQYRLDVERTGATFVPLPGGGERIAASRQDRGPARGMDAVRSALDDVFLHPLAAEYDTVDGLIEDAAIDVILTDPLFLGASVIGLRPRALRPPVIVAGIMPLPVSSRDVAPYGMALHPGDRPIDRVRNVALQALADRVLLAGVARRVKREVLRVSGRRLHGSLMNSVLLADAYVQLTVPEFEYPRRHLSPKVRFVGPPHPPAGFSMPDWWSFSDRRPVIYVAQAPGGRLDPTELIVPTIRAYSREAVQIVVTTGGEPVSVVEEAYGGPLPANCHVAQYLPYEFLLTSAAVMVTDGAYLLIQHALRYGVPLVVSGTVEGRGEACARVAWCGAGIDLGVQRPTQDAVRRAIDAVLTDPRYRRATSRVAAKIARTDAEGDLLALIRTAGGGTPIAAADPTPWGPASDRMPSSVG